MPPSQSASLFLRWLLCKRPLIRGQHPLPEHQSVHKEQHTEERSRQSLRAEQRDAVHIPAAEQAAQDAQIQRVQQQKRDCDVIQDRAQQFTPGAADGPCQRHQQVPHAEGRQRAQQAEDAELRIGHALGVDVDLHAEPHPSDLPEHPGTQGVQQVRALMDEIVGGDRRQYPDVFIPAMQRLSPAYREYHKNAAVTSVVQTKKTEKAPALYDLTTLQRDANRLLGYTAQQMLSVQEYCGDILNFKTYSKSYKNKKRLENDRANWAIFKDVHEPIIERAVFEQVQQKRGKMRKRQAKDGERSMFSGLLVCADCGSNLHFHFNQGNPEIKYFNCSNYKGNRGTCGSTHYVRVDFLEQVVLGEIRRLTKYADLYEDDFLKEVIGHSRQAEETERRLKEKELKSLLARDDELDGLFERIYEDNVSGKLSDDRFAKMSRRYEDEQKELSEKIKKLRSEIEKQSSRATSTDMFVSIVRKYTRARKLTPRMLNELVEKIEVFNAEKIDGEWVQRLRIHYNCVGEMNIPNEPALPIPAVTVNTRKGVFVSYTTDDRPAV